jgi:hypothetical protein
LSRESQAQGAGRFPTGLFLMEPLPKDTQLAVLPAGIDKKSFILNQVSRETFPVESILTKVLFIFRGNKLLNLHVYFD